MELFKTERLLIREIESSDFDNFMEIFQQAVAMTYYTKEQLADKVNIWIDTIFDSYKHNRYGIWICELNENKQFIGQCGFQKKRLLDKEYAELGTSILRPYWNKGYATEAAQGCVDYVFAKLKLKKVIAVVDDYNTAALRLLDKIGFTEMNITKKENDRHFYFEIANI